MPRDNPRVFEEGLFLAPFFGNGSMVGHLYKRSPSQPIGASRDYACGSRANRNVWSPTLSQAKNEGDRLVCANVYGLSLEHRLLALMECAAPSSYLVRQPGKTFPVYRFRERRVRPLCHLMVRQQTWPSDCARSASCIPRSSMLQPAKTLCRVVLRSKLSIGKSPSSTRLLPQAHSPCWRGSSAMES